MPNTLAHLGIQGVLGRRLLSEADLKWLYAGCIIPDLPWIIQRGVRFLFPSLDRYELLLYSGVQSSLFFCLILSAALALATRNPRRTFTLLGLTSLIHLVLDATQIKWANGVLLFAPFNWQLSSFGFYWPESQITVILTAFGLCYFLLMWGRSCTKPLSGLATSKISLFLTLLLMIFYFSSPLLFKQPMLQSDNYYLKTLLDVTSRTGKVISMDRATLLKSGEGFRVRNFSGELFEVEGVGRGEEPAVISLKGLFLAPDRIKVMEYHLHPVGRRELASMAGLCLVSLLWLCIVVEPVRRKVATINYQPYRASWTRKK